jgi:hypothetical protein
MALLADLLSAETHSTGIRIIRRAGRNRENTDAGSNDLVLGGGSGGLGGGSSSGKSENDGKSADGKLHVSNPFLTSRQLKVIDTKRLNRKDLVYRPRPIPQAFGSSGAQVGTGRTLTREATTLFWVEAAEVWVVAAAPVRTRTATNVRMMIFIMCDPFGRMFTNLLITKS